MIRQIPVAIVTAASAALLVAGCSQIPTSPSATTPSGQSAAPAAVRSVQVNMASIAQADGNTPARLTAAGWTCLNVPGHGVHCLAPGHAIGESIAIPVKVFDTSDPGSADAPFLGTETLIRADRYNGQPCLPGKDEYELLPFGYYACHHFDF